MILGPQKNSGPSTFGGPKLQPFSLMANPALVGSLTFLHVIREKLVIIIVKHFENSEKQINRIYINFKIQIIIIVDVLGRRLDVLYRRGPRFVTVCDRVG